MKNKRTSVSGIVQEIEGSKKQVTVMFTDIEGSTRLWESRGDVGGRLLVDRHNRLLFPAVKKYGGQIIKTIGDSILATYNNPGNAILAGIAMQQILKQERNIDSRFPIKIRIGIHTGRGLVESDDVFGDVVNVAARVESEASGNQILVSGSTASKLKNTNYHLDKCGSFKPRGKSEKINVFSCDWEKSADLVSDIKPAELSTVFQKQRLEMFFYALMTLFFVVLLYHIHLRYIIVDSESASLMMLNPSRIPQQSPVLAAILAAVLLVFFIYLYRLRFVSLKMLRVFKGISAATLVWIIYMGGIQFSGFELENKWNEPLYSSSHLFVEVLENGAPIRSASAETSKVLLRSSRGDLLLLNKIAEKGQITWNRVLIGPGQYGWIERVVPPRIGLPERRISYTDKYYFRYYDLYGLLLMLPVFIWGYFNFRLKPV